MARARRRGSSPNVVLIVADDLGSEVLGCYGGTSYTTPHLNRLAAEGLRFAHCYCTPLCTPSRVQLMSGQYPFRNGWADRISDLPRARQVLDPELAQLARILRSAGYATAVAGKWQLARFDEHPDHVRACGFDDYCLWTWRIGEGLPSRYWAPWIWQAGALRGELRRADVFGPDVYCDFLIDFVRRHTDAPFFAYYPMALPHLPFVEPPASGGTHRDADRFGRMVAYLDTLVGRLLQTLEVLGLRDQTLVLFTSDNGTAAQVTSLRNGREVRGGKGRMDDAGTRVPLIARWPGATPAGAVADALVDSSDVLPTLADVCRAQLPASRMLDGRSFARVLRGEPGSREWVHIQLHEERALRSRRWKLYRDDRLFDLERDPNEERSITPGAGGAEARAARTTLGAVFGSLG